MDEFGYVVNVDCAVVRDDSYLVIRRSEEEDHAAGLWGFPGGKLEAPPGTSGAIRRTARREVREETGVRVEDVAFVTSSVFESDGGTRVVNLVTIGSYESGTATARDPTEVAAVDWRTPAALRDGEAIPGFTLAALDAVEDHRASA